MRNVGLTLGCTAVLGIASTSWGAVGDVLVNEDFESYASTSAMSAVWAGFDGTLDLALGSDGLGGSAGQSAFHEGGSVNEQMIPGGAVFPTATEWLKLSVDIFDDDTNLDPPVAGVSPDNKRMSLGMRWFNDNPFNQIAENILELGMYNDTVPNAHHAYRAVIFNGAGGPTGNIQSWGGWDMGTVLTDPLDPLSEIDVNTFQGTGGAVWNRYSVIISPDTVTFEFDTGADGTVDFSDTFTDVITTAQGFDRIRFGGPSGITSLGGGNHFDNIVLERIAPIVASLLGDYNDDGFVGIEDLNLVLQNWNANVTPFNKLLGDGTGDGFVGIEDLNEILGNWNAGTPPPPGSVVPEPTTLALLGLGGVAMLRRRR